MVGILCHLRELFCSHLSDWIFLFDAFIGRDYYALCFFGRVASLRLDFSVRHLHLSRLLRSLFLWQSCISMIGIQRSLCELFCSHLLDFLSQASFLGRALFFWLSGLLLAFWPSSGSLAFFWLSGLHLAFRTSSGFPDFFWLVVGFLFMIFIFCLCNRLPFWDCAQRPQLWKEAILDPVVS
jgi:hypothetical protein